VELEQEIKRHGHGGRACAVACDVNRRIIEDDEALLHFTRVSQNIAVVVALLWGLPEPATPEDRRAHREIRTLLERTAAQQAESSLSRRHELDASQRTPVPVHQRLGRNRDARSTIDARRHAYNDLGEGARRGYHPRRGGCYDSGEDRSLSPGLPGPQAFGRHILNAAFPPRYRPLTNIRKYSGETNPGLWLEDYQLACQAGGTNDDDFIIRNLPLFLADSARAWLEHLPSNAIQSWADLREIFVGNFQGTYKRPRTHGTSRTAARRPMKPSAGTSGASPGSATSSLMSPTLT